MYNDASVKKYVLLSAVSDGDLLQTKNLIPDLWSQQNAFQSHRIRVATELIFE